MRHPVVYIYMGALVKPATQPQSGIYAPSLRTIHIDTVTGYLKMFRKRDYGFSEVILRVI